MASDLKSLINYEDKVMSPLLFLFRCVRQERISIRGSVRPFVRPSLGPSLGPYVRYASAKTASLGCFWPR